MAVIETASESLSSQLSTSVSCYLSFPPPHAHRRAYGLGSPKVMTEIRASLRSRSPLIDAFIRAAVLPVKTAALIKQLVKLYCCRLIKNYGFYSGSAPLLAYRGSKPPSKSFHPRI